MWVVILFSSCLNCVMSFSFCLCWKKNNPELEVDIIDGSVKKKDQDENVNHLSTADLTNIGDNEPDITKRTTLASNTRRSLPDIPSEQENIWEITIDNSSEHYACVEQYSTANDRQTISNDCGSRISISQHSSLSQADCSPYEKVKYDQIKTREHPYAQLKPQFSVPSENILEEGPSCYRTGSSPENVNTNKKRVAEETSEIPAASAVAGNIASSTELPYMTPAETNFSGDSQDSSKGYTSITVREPLSNILPQIVTEKRDFDPHYSTVSDDSDDVYTTIPDPCQEITHGSEILDSRLMIVEAEINQCSSHVNVDSHKAASKPSSSKKFGISINKDCQNTNTSGQDFVSDDSPKPERRSAKSPLPPTPVAEISRIPSTIDALYAKVRKNKEKTTTENGSENSSDENLATVSNYSLTTRNSVNDSGPGYEVIKKKGDCQVDYLEANGASVPVSSSDIKQLRDSEHNVSPYEVREEIDCYASNEENVTNVPEPSSKVRTNLNKKEDNCYRGNSDAIDSIVPSTSDNFENDLCSGYEVIKKRTNSFIKNHEANIPNSSNTVDIQTNFDEDICAGYEVIKKKINCYTYNLEASNNGPTNSEVSSPGYEVIRNRLHQSENDNKKNTLNSSSLQTNLENELCPGYEVISERLNSHADDNENTSSNLNLSSENVSEEFSIIMNNSVTDMCITSPPITDVSCTNIVNGNESVVDSQRRNSYVDISTTLNCPKIVTGHSNGLDSSSLELNISKDDIIFEV